MDSPQGEQIWVTRLVEQMSERTVGSPVLAGLFTLGLLPIFLTIGFLGLVDGPVSLHFLFSHILAAAVPVLGVPGIWYWDTKVYPRFVEQTTILAVDSEALRSDLQTYKQIFATGYRPFTVLWTVLVTVIIGVNRPYFKPLAFRACLTRPFSSISCSLFGGA